MKAFNGRVHIRGLIEGRSDGLLSSGGTQREKTVRTVRSVFQERSDSATDAVVSRESLVGGVLLMLNRNRHQ